MRTMVNLQKICIVFLALIAVLSVWSTAYLLGNLNNKPHSDAEQRLDLYRAAVEETEIANLNAADVFEKTEAFQQLLRMGESEQFSKNGEYDCN